jgi:hypothetical protein
VRPRRRQPTSDESQTQTRPNIQLDIGIGSRGGGRNPTGGMPTGGRPCGRRCG